MKRTLVAALLLVAAGCSKSQVDRVQDQFASAAPKLAGDGALYAQVESKLVSIDADSALHVAVSVHDGDVRLSGRVKSAQTQQRYRDAVRSISGVSNVDAALRVDPSLPSASKQARDFALAAAVRANLTAQAGINGVGLGIEAKDGVVTLDGHVKTDALHRTLVSAAKETSGVTAVVDRLHVDS